MKLNVERLEAYKARLVVLPKRKATAEQKEQQGVSHLAKAFPIPSGTGEQEKPREITAEEKQQGSAYEQLRKARSDARLVGVRAERERKKREEEEAKKKVSASTVLSVIPGLFADFYCVTRAVNRLFPLFFVLFSFAGASNYPPFFSQRVWCRLSTGVATLSRAWRQCGF